MQIVLLRHGKPKIPEFGKLKADELHHWIETYNLAPLDKSSRPAKQVIEIAKHCNTIVCSDLQRSIESAKVLRVKSIHYIDAIFREFELPYPESTLRPDVPKLSPNIWVVIFRIFWFLGYAPANCEPISATKQRANKAANLLQCKALSSETVLFVGHSLLNHFIGKELQSKG